jgi:hypothetical protein
MRILLFISFVLLIKLRLCIWIPLPFPWGRSAMQCRRHFSPFYQLFPFDVITAKLLGSNVKLKRSRNNPNVKVLIKFLRQIILLLSTAHLLAT